MFERYRHTPGAQRPRLNEFVCFDVDAPANAKPRGSEPARLRVWDRIDGDFVERVVEGDRTPCVTLSAALGADIEWTVAPAGVYPTALRLLRDGVLVPSPEEASAASLALAAKAIAGEAAATTLAAEATALAAEATAREAAANERAESIEAEAEAAKARFRELEAMLARK